MSQREKTLLLGSVMLIVCSLVFWEWLEPPNPSRLPPHAGQSVNYPSFPQPGLALDVSATKRTMTLKNPRNIFAPLKNPMTSRNDQAANVSATPKPPEPPPSPTISSPSPFVASGPSPAELAAKQAEREMQQYKFLGYLTKEGVRQGFLSKSETIYIVKQGETLEESITIQSIDATEVVLSKYVRQIGKTVEATLPLTNGDPS